MGGEAPPEGVFPATGNDGNDRPRRATGGGWTPDLRADSTPTHCPYCALQCGMSLVPAGDILEVAGRDFDVNAGSLCRKGWTASELLRAPDRLLSPLLRRRREEALAPASWGEAISFTVAKIAELQRAHGRDAIGVFGGGGLTNETAYMLGKFARVVLRSKHIDYNGRFCMASAAAAAHRALGIDRGLPFPIADIPSAQVILLVGTNPAETMPPLMRYFDEQRARGGQLLVADPRRTLTAEAATMHLQIALGSDAALANGLLHVAIRDKLIDGDYIAARTSGFETARHAVGAYWPDRVERLTGIPARRIVEVAHLLGEADSAMVLTGRGPEQQVQGVNNVLGFINLMLALGKVGKPASGWGCLTGQGNGQGGREHGQKADQLPGYRSLRDPADRALVAERWGVPEAELPPAGPSGSEMLRDLGGPGGVRALLVMGANPVVSAPDATSIERSLARLDLLVVSDVFLSETARAADVVLPVVQWAEHEGTMTNLEGRLLHRRRARRPPGEARTDLQVLKALADGLGRGAFVTAEPEAAFDELARVSAGGLADYGGMSYARLRAGEALHWPCPDAHHPGTPRLFGERFPTSDGRARFHAVRCGTPGEEPDDEYPLYLTTGRLLAHYQSGTQTRRVASLRDAEPEAFVEIHPQLAQSHGIGAGDRVRLCTRRGTATFVARLSAGMRLDTLFVPFHFGGNGRANTLVAMALDPISKIPEFKIAAVRLERSNDQLE
jgi:assimilatory nitrate reductase catalytic subunit